MDGARRNFFNRPDQSSELIMILAKGFHKFDAFLLSGLLTLQDEFFQIKLFS